MTHSLLPFPVMCMNLDSSIVKPSFMSFPQLRVLEDLILPSTEVVASPRLHLAAFLMLSKLAFVLGKPFEGLPRGIPNTGPWPFLSSNPRSLFALLGCRKTLELCLSLYSIFSIRAGGVVTPRATFPELREHPVQFVRMWHPLLDAHTERPPSS